jgi:hypothetical protein
MNNNSDKSINSMILNLESLIKEYENVLAQYNQVETDYINYLHQTKSNVSNTVSDLVYFKNKALWSKQIFSSSRVNNVQQCQALCSKNPDCKGATYNDYKNSLTANNCFLSSKDGMIYNAEDQYAIVFKSTGYLQALEGLNNQLLNLNIRILEAFEENDYDFSMQDKERFNKYRLLRINYAKLEEQRANLLEQLQTIQTLDSKQVNGELAVTKYYYNYILLFIVVVLCCAILSKIALNSISSQSTNNFDIMNYKYIFMIIIISILIMSFFNLN